MHIYTYIYIYINNICKQTTTFIYLSIYIYIYTHIEPHGATWGHMVHFVSRLDIWSHVGQSDAACAPIGYAGALGFQQISLLPWAAVTPILCSPLGMVGNAKLGGRVIANFVCPTRMVGNADEGRIHRHICVPSRYDWKFRRRADLSQISCPPLGMIGNADEGRSYRQIAPLSVRLGTLMKGGAIANFV